MRGRTEAIALRAFAYAEADLIVTFLTREMGIRKGFAKSPRKTKSRFGSALEPLTLSTITLIGREDASLPRLTQADIIRPHQGLREDYGTFKALAPMLELTLALLHENSPAPGAFELMDGTLRMLEREFRALYILMYRVRLLGLKGMAPRMSACGRCGARALTFFPREGAVLCPGCARGPDDTGLRMLPGAVRLYAALGEWDLPLMGRLRPAESIERNLSAALDAHIRHVVSAPH